MTERMKTREWQKCKSCDDRLLHVILVQVRRKADADTGICPVDCRIKYDNDT